jgi:hypothetical protein
MTTTNDTTQEKTPTTKEFLNILKGMNEDHHMWVAQHPRVPPEVLRKILKYSTFSLKVRAAAAKNPNATPEVLMEGVKRYDTTLPCLENPNANGDVFSKAMESRRICSYDMCAILKHPNVTFDFLLRSLKHPNPEVGLSLVYAISGIRNPFRKEKFKPIVEKALKSRLKQTRYIANSVLQDWEKQGYLHKLDRSEFDNDTQMLQYDLRRFQRNEYNRSGWNIPKELLSAIASEAATESVLLSIVSGPQYHVWIRRAALEGPNVTERVLMEAASHFPSLSVDDWKTPYDILNHPKCTAEVARKVGDGCDHHILNYIIQHVKRMGIMAPTHPNLVLLEEVLRTKTPDPFGPSLTFCIRNDYEHPYPPPS